MIASFFSRGCGSMYVNKNWDVKDRKAMRVKTLGMAKEAGDGRVIDAVEDHDSSLYAYDYELNVA